MHLKSTENVRSFRPSKGTMYSFIVGGFLPGTNVQISFQAYLAIMILGGGLTVAWIERRRQVFTSVVSRSRQPLPASQLHHRLTPMAR